MKGRTREAVVYPPGYFTELMRAADFPPGFVSRYRGDRAPVDPTQIRAQGGWHKLPVVLPGSAEPRPRAE